MVNIRSIFHLSIYLCVTLSLIACTQGNSQQGPIVESKVTSTPQSRNTSIHRPTPTVSPFPSIEPTSTISTTDSGWVEYENDLIGVSFQHPESWIITVNEPEQFVRTGAGSHARGMVYTIDRWDDVEGYDAIYLLEFAKDFMVTETWKGTDDIDQIADINEFEVEGNSAASTIYRRGSGDDELKTEYYFTAITDGDSAVIVRGVIMESLVDDEPETYRKVVNSIRILPK